MGAFLEMTVQRLWIILAVVLAGCGSNPASNDNGRSFKDLAVTLNLGQAGAPPSLTDLDPTTAAALRQILQKDGQAITLVAHPALHYSSLMAPYGRNGDVQTWSSEKYETIALRQGMLIASRGFGADLMSADAPSLAQIASGHGSFARRYFYLNGGDQTQQYDFACNLASGGAEAITIMAKTYAARKVTESCSGATGSFSNDYWFDNGNILRQSHQMVIVGRADMVLQRVID